MKQQHQNDIDFVMMLQGKYATLSTLDPPENCVHMYPNGEWNNANCKEPRGYVCAGPIPAEGKQYFLKEIF